MTDTAGSQSESTAVSHGNSSLPRQLTDGIACLALAVILFRTFAVEGYIISTGSMAPNLLGFHKRVVCPACHFPFSVGVPHDRIDAIQQPAACPNCGQKRIRIRNIPRNEGDQLLVHKHAFSFRPPRRWETAVFQNPNKPTEIFVKRIVGLPAERLQVVHGDIYVNEKIQRKNLVQQLSIRVPVYDFDHKPTDDPLWQPRWVADSRWNRTSRGFQIDSATSDQPPAREINWVRYRHWIRSGGVHKSSVEIAGQPISEELKENSVTQVRFEPTTNALTCTGVLRADVRDQLLANLYDPRTKQAVRQLESASHVAPILDSYGYNREATGPSRNRVTDLMLALRLSNLNGNGQLLIRMAYRQLGFVCVFDFPAKEVRIHANNNPKPLRTFRFETGDSTSLEIEMSVMDRQVLVAVNNRQIGTLPFDHKRPDKSDAANSTNPWPVQFGVYDLGVSVDSIKLYRDVYYTGGIARHGIGKPFQLGADEYFVLGDNSPVSHDSRDWETATVKKVQLVGKPFLVHLPSRPGRIKIGEYQSNIRIPDISRIRYIH